MPHSGDRPNRFTQQKNGLFLDNGGATPYDRILENLMKGKNWKDQEVLAKARAEALAQV